MLAKRLADMAFAAVVLAEAEARVAVGQVRREPPSRTTVLCNSPVAVRRPDPIALDVNTAVR